MRRHVLTFPHRTRQKSARPTVQSGPPSASPLAPRWRARAQGRGRSGREGGREGGEGRETQEGKLGGREGGRETQEGKWGEIDNHMVVTGIIPPYCQAMPGQHPQIW